MLELLYDAVRVQARESWKATATQYITAEQEIIPGLGTANDDQILDFLRYSM